MKMRLFKHKCASRREVHQSVYFLFLFYLISFLYWELILRMSALKTFFGIGLLYIFLFSISASFLCFTLSVVFPKRANRIVSLVITVALTVLYASQFVYSKIFRTFYTLFSAKNGSQVLQFWREVVETLKSGIVPFLLLLVPFLLLLLFGNRFIPYDQERARVPLCAAGLCLATHFLAIGGTLLGGQEELSPYDLYFNTINIDYSVEDLGLLTTMRLDAKRMAFGFTPRDSVEQDVEEEFAQSGPGSVEPSGGSLPGQADSEYNILDINFESLINGEADETIANMHKYFSMVEPTKKNSKTGSERGRNLIMITAESFSPYAIDKNLTPTLYKMMTQGYQFTNFYNPLWGVSTSDGEYVNLLSTLPKPGEWSMRASSENLLPFSMGNQLKKQGYLTNAYHNHAYTYYGRDQSHPNLGYNFKALGNGLDIAETWPESDLEMVEKTLPEYIGKEPFHIYYMTVSGHLEYNFSSNAMAIKNQDLVKDLPYSEACKAYLACNIELDRAMEKLLNALEEAGVAENTLISLSPDHYPYALSNQALSELAGHEIEENFELYHSVTILYRKGMTPEVVDKPCSSLDILPTLSNLMGLEYDSRLLMGQDIFSDSDPLVIFNNRSWITGKAFYHAKKRELTPTGNETVTEEYRKEISQMVSEKFAYSTKILENDYYRKLLG